MTQPWYLPSLWVPVLDDGLVMHRSHDVIDLMMLSISQITVLLAEYTGSLRITVMLHIH